MTEEESVEELYQSAAQDIRTARASISEVKEKSLGDHLALLALGIVEEHLTGKHQSSEHQGREERRR